MHFENNVKRHCYVCEDRDIAPLYRLPTKAPAAIQQSQYVLNKIDSGSR